MREFVGVVRLPEELMVTGDALGSSFECRADTAAFALAFPEKTVLTDIEGGGKLLALDPPSTGWLWAAHAITALQEGNDWGYCSNFDRLPDGGLRPAAWTIGRLAMRISLESDDDTAGRDLVARFGSAFDEWFSIALDWFELWSGATPTRGALRRLEPSRGQVREVGTQLGGITGWGARLGTLYFWEAGRALSMDELASGFEKASAGVRPPAEWELFLRSQRATDERIAIIEAATAVEVALARALDSRLSSVDARARQLITKQSNGLMGLLKLLEAFGGVEAESLVGEVMRKLAKPRNDAVHRGASPIDSQVASQASATAKAVLDRYSPLEPPLNTR